MIIYGLRLRGSIDYKEVEPRIYRYFSNKEVAIKALNEIKKNYASKDPNQKTVILLNSDTDFEFEEHVKKSWFNRYYLNWKYSIVEVGVEE